MSIVRIGFLLAVLCASTSAWTKGDFRDGFIILNSNDTIRGLVELDPGLGAFRSCQFKESDSAEVRSYYPDEIRGYVIYMGRVYLSRKIQRQAPKAETMFLRLIIRGHVSLYEIDNEFYVEKGDVPYRLSNEETESYANGQRILKKTNKHIAVLNMLMSDQPELARNIREITLTEKHLIKLVEDYNKLKGSATINYNEDKPRAPLDASNVLTREAADGFNHYESLLSSQRSNAQYGQNVSVTPVSPANYSTFSFLGGKVSTASSYPAYTLINPSFPMTGGYFVLGSNQLNGRFGNYYSSNDFKVAPYINMGFSGNHDADPFTPAEPGGAPFHHAAFARDPFLTGTNQFGYWGGLGVSRPFTTMNTYLELRYQQLGMAPMGQMGYMPGLQSNVTNVQFVIGFRRK